MATPFLNLVYSVMLGQTSNPIDSGGASRRHYLLGLCPDLSEAIT